MQKIISIILAIIMLVCIYTPVYACDDYLSTTYIEQILFGSSASAMQSNEKAILLMDAVFLCLEQSDNAGQEQLNRLKEKKVSSVPDLSKINLYSADLLKTSHAGWDTALQEHEGAFAKRKQLLQNSVNRVFDFGLINNIFGSKTGKCNDFSALLYYFHILSDYLADNPDNTEINVRGISIEPFSGEPSIEIKGNIPNFTASQKHSTNSFTEYSDLDNLGRCGVAFANLGPSTLAQPNSRENIGSISPSGWNQNYYPGMVNSGPSTIYNRSHLIAHQLAGEDGYVNLITGTTYMNADGMKPYEDKVADYIRSTGNHVLYRVTPIYKGDNLVASGVQMEAYSVEDNGTGICFNVYCYNVQPGIEIQYTNGTSQISDVTFGEEEIIPFVSESDELSLTGEIEKYLTRLFNDSSNEKTFNKMINDLNSIANEAKTFLRDPGYRDVQKYIGIKKYMYQYYDVLETNVPLLLGRQDFFKSAFN